MMDLAERVSRAYESLPGLAMSLVTGSVARGVADDSSDLDVYLYWDHVDVGTLASSGRAEGVLAARLLALPTATGFFEKYRSGDRLVDVESVTIESLAGVASSLDRCEPMSPLVAKTMAGLRDAVPLRGAETLEAWRSRLTYSAEQAVVEVGVNLRRFLPPLAIHDLTLVRGDIISFSARMSTMALAAIGAVAAVNRYPLALEDPKWLPWHVAQLTRKPPDFLRRMQAPFATPDRSRVAEFASALSDTLDLVDNRCLRLGPTSNGYGPVLVFPPDD